MLADLNVTQTRPNLGPRCHQAHTNKTAKWWPFACTHCTMARCSPARGERTVRTTLEAAGRGCTEFVRKRPCCFSRSDDGGEGPERWKLLVASSLSVWRWDNDEYFLSWTTGNYCILYLKSKHLMLWIIEKSSSINLPAAGMKMIKVLKNPVRENRAVRIGTIKNSFVVL